MAVPDNESHIEAAAEHAAGPSNLPDLTQVPIDQRDKVWFETYYQGDTMPQLTVRAVVMGMFLGGVMSLSNLYVGLKTGWGLGVAITSCILSYAIWNAFLQAGLAKTKMSVLENNCMQSTASSAGSSTGGTMVSAIAAYLLITGTNMPFWQLFIWTASLAVLGTCIAIPMKRQMINHEQLKFPSGIAAAETLRSLHAAGGEALQKARALFVSMALGVFIKFWIEGLPAVLAKLGKSESLGFLTVPGEKELPVHINGKEASAFGLALPVDPLMIAAGAIVGLRTSVSMAVGAVVLYAILGPWLDDNGIFKEMAEMGALASPDVGPGNIRKWGLWTGSAMMVSSGLMAFAFQWRSIVAALSGLGSLFSAKKTTVEDPMDAIEVPNSWFAIGVGLSSIAIVAIMWVAWDIAPYWGVVSIFFAFVLSLVACRACGETDITPIGAMGKVTQLFYGMTIQGQPVPNLMTAGVTAGAAGAAADLLTDLKSGYLLGANPRQQTIAQLMGIIAGTLVVVPVWYVLVPDASAIGSESKNFPAPAAEVWASVARLLAKGLDSLHPTILTGMVVGAVIGVVLTVIEQQAPKHIKKWVPSPTGLGLAFVIGFSDSIAFLVGAVLAEVYKKMRPTQAPIFTVPVSSGIIAGESIMGIVIALLSAGGSL